MRKFRTKKSNRETYRYYFVTGESHEIKITDEVTASDISLLHQLDDEEVNAEHRERYHVAYSLDNFLTDGGRKNYFLLVDENHPLEEILKGEEYERQVQVFEILSQALETMTPKQRETIRKIFYEGFNRSELAREQGVSEAAIRHRLSKIYRKLKKNIRKRGSK